MLEFILAKILVWAITLCIAAFIIWCFYCMYDCIQSTESLLEQIVLTIVSILLGIILLLGIVICILNGTAKELLL